MKKLVVMMMLGLAVAATSQAQNGSQRDNRTEQDHYDRGNSRDNQDRKPNVSPEQMATKRTEVLQQKLDLNKSQTKKLQALNLKHAQQVRALRGQFAKGGEKKPKQVEQMQRLRADWDKEFKKIASKKQYAQYELEKKQMQASRRGKRIGKQHS
ncbi:hypothetical protein FVR03_12190 [Pontibacter qinzhouensis]|uniref:DUF4890 domain-containing protein n=1 Tax=Pontibacter qinzhouensis TaxID=2603253 RepID=A0A5C8K618_9BACT|nr:hypothetical protein [Pontibacter qinzhouensis]TXK45701.1 hypothetical protein FVR03_12190 [Pontibacter qinzhouensis]